MTLGTGVGGAVIADGTSSRARTARAASSGTWSSTAMSRRPAPVAAAAACSSTFRRRASCASQSSTLAAHPEQPSAMRGAEKLTAKIVFDSAAAGDAAAQAALETVYDAFGFFLAAGCTVSDPEAVVIGGGVSRAGAPLLEARAQAF